MSCRIIPGSSRAVEPVAWRQAASSASGAGVVTTAQTALGRSAADNAEMERVLAIRVQQAREDGFRQGFSEGEQRAAERMASLSARMARAIEETAGFRMRLRRGAEQGIVDLALAVARRILHREISLDPEALLGVVKAAAERISVRELVEVRVHPSQVEMVTTHLEAMGSPAPVRVTGDPSLEPGALWFETERGLLDASVDTQIEEIRRGFADRVGRNA